MTKDKVELLLKYVVENNLFYQERAEKYHIQNPYHLEEWPVLTRKELQEGRFLMFSNGYKTQYFNQLLIRKTTSGSSGVPVNIYWDRNDYYRSSLSLWRKRLAQHNITPCLKYVMFTLNGFKVHSPGDQVLYDNQVDNILSINISLIHNSLGYLRIIDLIDDFKPVWLYIQPFVLNQLLLAYLQSGKRPPKSIRYIESVGEMLSADLRRRAESLFGFAITNMYGSEEMNAIAYENLSGELEIVSDNVFLEIEKDGCLMENGEGSAIVTNLNNYAMPLIRYEQGDRIVKKDKSIQMVEGRNNECFDGLSFSPFMISEAIAEVNNELNDHILAYKTELTHSKIGNDTVLFNLMTDGKCDAETLCSSLRRIVSEKTDGKVHVGTICFETIWENEKKRILMK